ncbi:Tim44/TimA family putative adaptor protein [Tistlia consotensis]|uniref:Tim44/TimA family putative adaptor protein n=1 Tax=Tistlia consotensis TaxID=1321365 RepID=UPI001FD62BAB|nr:Tim44/TimA family putative adaptor protein [Tistlia consotensis]
MDILFFAAIAAFLVLRLRSVLGKRTGHQSNDFDPFRDRQGAEKAADEKIVRLPDGRRPAEPQPADQPEDTALAGTERPAVKGVAAVRAADPAFDEAGFLQGARAAFEMIVTAFAQGDAKALRPLLADEVYKDFSGAIDERQARKETLDTTLVGIEKAELAEAELQGRTAFVTVRFVSQQVNVTRDAEDRIVDGDANEVETITDLWTFARNVKSRDPNWKLVATQSSQ